MIDNHILASCIKSRSAYERVRHFLKPADTTPPIGFWLERVIEYYDRDIHAQNVSLEVLREIGVAQVSNPKQVEGLCAVLSGLPADVSPENVTALVLDLRRRNLVLELAQYESAGDRKKADKAFAELNSVWEMHELQRVSDVEYARDWADLDSVIGAACRIPLGIPALDNRIGGGVLPGHHVLIFGRTEIGKSCFTVATAASLVKSGHRVLYIGNEDEINILKARIRLSILGWNQEQLDKMPNKGLRLLGEYAGDRLVMAKLTPGSMPEVADLIEKHHPTVVVLDQIRSLDGPGEMTQRMEHNAIRFRSLLNKHRLIGISVAQAGDRSSGHNVDGPVFLSAGDVDSSRVGLPGTADLQIGIGCNQDLLSRGLRQLNFAKNKLSSQSNSREPLYVRFDLARSMVLDG